MSEQQIASITESLIRRENIVDAKVTTRQSTKKGEGYASERHFVDITGSNKTLSLLFKCMPSVQGSLLAIVGGAFDVESYFYGKVVPGLDDFLKSRRVNDGLSLARCFRIVNDDTFKILVFDNLISSGYTLRNPRINMRLGELTLVMEQYGKFHANSFALHDQMPAVFEELTKDMKSPFNDLMLGHFQAQIEGSVVNVVELYCAEKTGVEFEKLEALKTGAMEFLNFTSDRGRYYALLHGDCWNNNILFKYETKDEQVPSDAKFIDFQITRVGCPVLDLSYFFYTAACKEDLRNLYEYLQIYYRSFARRARELGSDPNVLYPYEELKNDWRTYCKFGYIMGMSVLNVMYRDDDEIIEIKNPTQDNDYVEFFQQKSRNDQVIRERLIDLTAHMFENGFI